MSLPAHYSHPGRYTPAEVLAWPEDGIPHEVIEGALYVSPHANMAHQLLVRRLTQALETALPATWEVLGPINLQLDASTLLVPDLAVLSTVRRDSLAAEPQDAELVVEVVSPGSTRIDRVTKPALYTEAGLHVWVFDRIRDPAGPLLRVHRPGFADPVIHPAGSTVVFAEPFPVTLDLGGLLR